MKLPRDLSAADLEKRSVALLATNSSGNSVPTAV